ncbi:hypothetical protein [Sphingobium xenophagum]|uniref:hypothetical protein n=1 Tax=Sphingobium xenophagum TaxID=121428 RepID=UPI001C0B1790|nr:hypothetical protein [Sphingobium xenophagum]QWT16214.1 hypothetical protein GTV57_19370 [Sphingobium xenophagum]
MLGKERAAYEAIQANSNAAGRGQADQLCTGCSTAFSDFVIDRWKWRGGAGRHGVAVRAGASVSNGVQKGPPIGVEEGPPFQII